MATLAELTVAEELAAVREIAAARGWPLTVLDPLRFHLGFSASDGAMFYLLVICDNYPVQPPAWHWCNVDGTRIDQASDKPKGSGYLHPSGVICAPWNRLAYKSVNARGPHGDWTIGNWQNNAHTHGCTALAAMAVKIRVELNSPRYNRGRLG